MCSPATQPSPMMPTPSVRSAWTSATALLPSSRSCLACLAPEDHYNHYAEFGQRIQAAKERADGMEVKPDAKHAAS
jgi:hypothetical protein